MVVYWSWQSKPDSWAGTFSHHTLYPATSDLSFIRISDSVQIPESAASPNLLYPHNKDSTELGNSVSSGSPTSCGTVKMPTCFVLKSPTEKEKPSLSEKASDRLQPKLSIRKLATLDNHGAVMVARSPWIDSVHRGETPIQRK
jgi:hypothetical protein